MSHQQQPQQVARKAEFSERALAFAADYAVFAAIWFVALKARARSENSALRATC